MTAQELSAIFDQRVHVPKQLLEMGREKAERGWSDFLTEISFRMQDAAFAEGFRNAVPVVGTNTSEYNYRFVEEGELKLVLSLRFRALATNEPFIEVLLCNKPLDSTTVSAIAATARREYASFHPNKVRYFSPNSQAFGQEDQEDQAFYVGNIKTIQRSLQPEGYERVQLKQATSLDWYDDLVEGYADVTEKHGLRAEPIESLELALAQGLVFEVIIEDQWAGLMAGRRLTQRFFSGVLIVDEVLKQKFRGMGYAPIMQRKFIDQIPTDDLIFGEILAWNERSRRTAMRVGREKCGTTFFHAI